MAYAINQIAKARAEIMGAVRSSAAAQEAGLSQAERAQLNDDIAEAELTIDQHSGEDDMCSVMIAGSISQNTDPTPYLSIFHSVAVTISKRKVGDVQPSAPGPTEPGVEKPKAAI